MSRVRIGVVQAVHGNRVSVRVGSSARVLKRIPVAGDAASLKPGDTIPLQRIDNQMYAFSEGDAQPSGGTGAIPSTSTPTSADHVHSEYTEPDVAEVVTANWSFTGDIDVNNLNITGTLTGAAIHDPVTIGAGGLSGKLGLSGQELTLGAINHSDLSNVGAGDHHNPVTIGTSGLSDKLSVSGQELSLAAINHADLSNVTESDHHNPVTIGTGGLSSKLSVSGQQLSLADISHAELLNLNADDHPQYAHLSQEEQIVAAWTFATNLYTHDLIPEHTDSYDIGSATKLYRKGWLSELESVLFVENSIQVTGGWWMVPHSSGTLNESLDTAETSIDFGVGTGALAVNDFIILRDSLKIEYMQITADNGDGTYTVTRNVDGSGADAWPTGHVWVNLGYDGDGRIEFDAQNTTEAPRISVREQGTLYNSQTERVRIGNLNGWGDYAAEIYGIAIGTWGNNYFTYDPTNGVRIAGDGSGLTQIDGAHIQTGSIAADKLSASYIEVGGAASDVNNGTTTIDGGKITAGSITADRLSVGSLSAITADLGTVTAGQMKLLTSGTIGGGNATGLVIDDNFGYDSRNWHLVALNAGTWQIGIDTSGALVAGDGNVVLDNDGLRLNHGTAGWSKVKWGTSTNTYSHIFTDRDITNGRSGLYFRASTDGDSSQRSELSLWSGQYGEFSITVDGNSIAAFFDTYIYFNRDLYLYQNSNLEVEGTVTLYDANNVAHYFEPASDGTSGVVLRTSSNQNEIFQVRSSGGAVRFAVYHANKTYVHDNLEIGQGEITVYEPPSVTYTWPIIARSSEISHQFTNTEYGPGGNDFYFFVRKLMDNGGAYITGIAESGWGTGMWIDGIVENYADVGTGINNSTNAAMVYRVSRNAGNGANTQIPTNGNYNAFVWKNFTDNLMILTAKGDLMIEDNMLSYQWDEYDDLELVEAVRATLSPDLELKGRTMEMFESNKRLLEETGVLHFDEDANKVFISVKSWTYLLADAIRQMGMRLERYEEELVRLGADPHTSVLQG